MQERIPGNEVVFISLLLLPSCLPAFLINSLLCVFSVTNDS